MTRTVKPHSTPAVDDFFAGVDEMRALLDRELQDPERRRGRLAAIAGELLKPRAKGELCRWLVSELAVAIGANVASILVREHGAFPLVSGHTVGVPPEGSVIPTLDEVVRLAANEAELFASSGAVVVPLKGIDGIVGALWLVIRTPLDAGSAELLRAIADTAGVALEQAILLHAMG